MSVNSNFYRVTPQIMLEYRTNQYDIIKENTQNDIQTDRYYVYKGLDGELYYTEDSRHVTDNKYLDQNLYQKFPDTSRSKYTYYRKVNDSDRLKISDIMNYVQENGIIDYATWIKRTNASLSDNQNGYYLKRDNYYNYDKINIFLLRGFNFDTLDGISIRVIAKGIHHIVDDDRQWDEPVDITLLDYYLKKEMLFDSSDDTTTIKYLDTPIYMNSKFYDRYVTVELPSAYSIGLSDMKARSSSGIDSEELTIVMNKYDEYGSMIAGQVEQYLVNPYDSIIIEFATVSETNVVTDEININGVRVKRTVFSLDAIDEGVVNLQSNTDFFNVRMYEENGSIIYYPVYGDLDNQMELDDVIMAQINSGAIPITANGFADMTASAINLTDLDRGDDTLYYAGSKVESKWKIYNDLDVGYQIGSSSDFYYEAYSRIIDYEQSGSGGNIHFWRSKFTPDQNIITDLGTNKISLKYTCRLVNEMRGVEVIRIATLIVSAKNFTQNISKYLNINTYKIVNQIQSPLKGLVQQTPQIKEKYIRSYYNATNLVAKNLGTGGNIYTQGQMTLRLNRTNNNYLVQLFRLNDDNVRIPYDLTGPYKYKIIFPIGDGTGRLVIAPNYDNKKQNLGIGTLVFYITGEQAQQIMQVPDASRFFAIMTDINGSAAQETTLYEGKVDWLS